MLREPWDAVRRPMGAKARHFIPTTRQPPSSSPLDDAWKVLGCCHANGCPRRMRSMSREKLFTARYSLLVLTNTTLMRPANSSAPTRGTRSLSINPPPRRQRLICLSVRCRHSAPSPVCCIAHHRPERTPTPTRASKRTVGVVISLCSPSSLRPWPLVWSRTPRSSPLQIGAGASRRALHRLVGCSD